jgi:hypothetical protein
MGAFGLGCKSCVTNPYAPANSGNPNPALFNVIQEQVIYTKRGAPVLVLQANYPGCTNFEGYKIMVYLDIASSRDLLMKTKGVLDPHFADEVPTSPIARFMPTPAGWALAIMFAKHLAAVTDKENDELHTL